MSPAVALDVSTFGRYELLEHLGGGMADVYRARDTVIGKIVAVKILKSEHAADPEVKARFLDEARIAAALDHPHIINVFDYGEANGRAYMVMEFLRGQDLRCMTRNVSANQVPEKLRLALQLAETLEYTHSQGVVHRDIKPENVHLNSDGVIRLLDFGIAKSAAASLKTKAGYVVGTVFYMAPEQVRGHASKLVDVYAFGLVLFEMLTGVRAVNGTTHEQVFYCILNEPLNLAPLQRMGVPPALEDLICRCTAKDPSKRPQSFQAVSRDLKQIMADLAGNYPTQIMPSTPAVKKALGWRTYALIACTALSLVGFSAWFLSPPSKAAVVVPPASLNRSPAAAPALSPILQDATGEMVLVPAGDFKFGKNKETRTLPAFYIDKTEVTNQAYAQFVNTSRGLGGPEYPVVNVTVAEARGFCEAAGKRLPTMYEWEKAARGAEGREYPWGNEPDATRANVRDNPILRNHKLMPADSFSEPGKSPFGALNMAGNVWEFVSDTRPPTYEELNNAHPTRAERTIPWPIMYGGSFSENVADASSNVKSWDYAVVRPSDKQNNLGFRCAKTP